MAVTACGIGIGSAWDFARAWGVREGFLGAICLRVRT